MNSYPATFKAFAFILLLNPALVKAQPAQPVDFRTVTLLHHNESYRAHTFAADALWVGKSKREQNDSHRIEVYVDQGTRLLGTVNLNHTPSFAYPYGQDSVLVVGKSFSDQWRTHYTVIKRTGDQLNASTKTLPIQFQIDQAAANEQVKFFSETGDAKVLVEANGRAIRALAPTISGPGKMQLVGDSLFVLENRDSFLGDENIVKIDLKTETAERTFKDYLRQGITDIHHIAGTNILAANEALTGKVLFIDEITNKLVGELSVLPDIRNLETLGHCLLAAATESRQLAVIDIRNIGNPSVLASLDLSSVGEILRRPNGLAVDQKRGTIFVRSTWTCPTCAPNTQSSVVAISESQPSAIAQCLAN